MALTERQTQLKSLLTIGIAASIMRSWPDPDAPLGFISKPLSEWVTNGNASLLMDAVNDNALGESLGLSVAQTLIPSSAINEAVAAGDEYPATISLDSIQKLTFILQHPTFDFGKAGVVQSVEDLLEPYPDCLAKFQALKVRFASINAALFEGKLTMEDISAITDPNNT